MIDKCLSTEQTDRERRAASMESLRQSFASSRRQLILAILLANVAVCIVAAISLGTSYRIHRDSAAAASRKVGRLVALNVSDEIQRIDTSLNRVIREYVRERSSGRADHRLTGELMDRQRELLPLVSALQLTDERGEILFASTDAGNLPLPSIDSRDLSRLRANVALFVSQDRETAPGESGSLLIGRSLLDRQGHFEGVVIAAVPVDRFKGILQKLELAAPGTIELRDTGNQGFDLLARFSTDPSNFQAFISPEAIARISGGPASEACTILSREETIHGTIACQMLAGSPLVILAAIGTEGMPVEFLKELVKIAFLLLVFALMSALGGRLVLRTWKARTEAHANERRRVEWALQASEKSFRTLLKEKEAMLLNVMVGIAVVRDRLIVDCNRRFEEIYGYDRDEMIGQSVRILFRNDDDSLSTGRRIDTELTSGRTFNETVGARRKDGTPFWAEIAGRIITTDSPTSGSLWMCSDVTERVEAQQKNRFLAYHDMLTGLPNRLLFRDRFDQARANADRERAKLALLFLDLDQFKTINDSLGHQAGDRLLTSVGRRITESLRESDTVSRQGGDEFLVLLPNVSGAEGVATPVSKIMKAMKDPFELERHELNISLSVGVAIYPDDGPDFETLAKRADMAMYRAKEAGRNTYRFFDEQMNIEAVEHLTIRSGLRRALERGEFVLHYQPQIDLATNSIVGAEALVRWEHPDRGLVAPGRFITVAEESQLIVPMGEWVLYEACRQAVAWRRSGMPEVIVAVNVSAMQFKHGNLEQAVAGALDVSGINPACLELEITESTMIQNVEDVLSTVQRLKQMGVRLSIDDFGTGYSSLSYLKRFKVDQLKVDQSFVRDLITDPNDAAIVRAIVQMGRSLNLNVVAEGVETADSLARLRALDVDRVQGYYFAHPMKSAEFGAYLTGQQATAPSDLDNRCITL